MTALLQVSLGMFTNVLVTLGCVFLVTRVLNFLAPFRHRYRSLVLGGMFGATAIASMVTAFPISVGVYGDMRNAIIAIAALTGGPLAALVCAAIAMLFRFLLGGQFIGAISAILLCAGLSIAFALAPLRKSKANLALFGVALALLNAFVPFIGWFIGIAPFATVVAVAEAIFGSAILLYPASIVIVAGLITAELRRLDTVSGLRTRNAQLSLSERRFLSVFDMSCIPMAWIDLTTTKFVRVNKEYEIFSGYGAEELLNMQPTQLSVPEDADSDLDAVRTLSSGMRSLQGERRYRRKDGSVRWGSRTLTLSDEEGEPELGFAIIQDITERKIAATRILYLAEHDHLTGLSNRFQFGKSLESALADPSCAQVAVFIIDLDDFKGVNDTRGHPVGDQVLVHIAGLMKSAVNASDQVARIGGDEFAVTQCNATAPDAMALADRLISLIGAPFNIEGVPVSVQASVGIAMSPGDGADSSQLFKRADIALYASKAAGKGMTRLFAPAMEERLLRRERLKSELNAALIKQEFELEFQPVVEIATGLVCRFEALLRWNHPIDSRVSPAEFIPMAEETGAIVEIGVWVIEQACLAATTWPGEVGVAVNVSVRQFEPTLPLKIAAALFASGLSPDRLEIEITESVLMQGSDEGLAILRQIKSLGVGISLDDFGTGYSSLSYLQRFPFHTLKIDKSFISGKFGTNEAEAIVRSVIQLGHSLNMKVTAEGVETHEQLERVRMRGCDDAQGFLFSASVPSADVKPLIFRLNNQFASPKNAVLS